MRSSDSLIVISGATGWVGRNILEILQKKIPNKDFNANVKCLASKKQFINSTGYVNNSQIEIPIEDFKSFPEICKNVRKLFLIHTAFLTPHHLNLINYNDYCLKNIAITKTIREGILICKDSRVVLVSSGIAREFDESYKEEVNYNDVLKNPYGYLKKKEEIEISKITNTLILRIFSLSGKFIREPSIYAFPNFILKALRKEKIEFHDNRLVYRSYGHAKNIAQLACQWLLTKQKKFISPLNTVSETIDLFSLARIISQQFDLPIVKLNRDSQYNDSSYTSNNTDFLNALKEYRIPASSLKDQIIETAIYLEKNYIK